MKKLMMFLGLFLSLSAGACAFDGGDDAAETVETTSPALETAITSGDPSAPAPRCSSVCRPGFGCNDGKQCVGASCCSDMIASCPAASCTYDSAGRPDNCTCK
jgi:hypothetical protein